MKRRFELGRQPANTKLGERRVHQIRAHGGYIKFRALKLDHGNYAWPGEAVTRKCRIIGVVYNPTNGEFVRTNTLVKGSVIQIDATPFKNWYQKHYGVVVGKPVDFVKEKKTKKGEKKSDKKEKKVVKKPEVVLEKKVVTKKADVKPTTKKPATKKTETAKPKAETKVAKTTDTKPEGKKKKKVYTSTKHHASGAMLKKWRLRNATRVLEAAISEQFEKGRLYAKISTSPGQTGTADGYVLEGEELAFYVKKMGLKKKK